MCPTKNKSSKSKHTLSSLISYMKTGDWMGAKINLENWEASTEINDDDQQESPAQEKDEQGNTPLHVILHTICREQCISFGQMKLLLEIFHMLIEYDPKAVLLPNFDGELPIHLACHKKVEVPEIIDSLLSAVPDSLGGLNYGTSTTYRLPLHEACAQGKSVYSIQPMLQRFPNAASYADKEGQTPLHLACCHPVLNQNYIFIEELVAACPQALHLQNENGNAPLHLACENNAPPNIIHFLIKNDPEAVRIQNWEMDLPIHLACRCHDMADEIVPMLLKQFPASSKMRGKISGLPLHEACGNAKICVGTVKSLIESYPESIGISAGGDGEGLNLPLHFACDAKSSKEIVEFLLQKYPQAAGFPDPDGLLPIHLAVSPGDDDSTCHPEIVKALLSSYPAGACLSTKSGNLPLHQACIRSFFDTNYDDLQQVVQILVDAFPGARYCVSKSGKRPLDIANACLARQRFLSLLTFGNHTVADSTKNTSKGSLKQSSPERIHLKPSFAENKTVFESLCDSAETVLGVTVGDLTILAERQKNYCSTSS